MATKKQPGKKTAAEKSKKAAKRVATTDLDTKKDPKGGPNQSGWLPSS